MMDNKDEFYIGYSNKIGVKTKKKTRFFVLVSLLLIILVGLSFSYFQRPAANSSFDFDTPTLITGIYHESPYPTLRLTLEENVFKDVVLLGFGKYGPEAYLKNFSQDAKSLIGKQISISGNLIYYNGKTLLQIDDSYQLQIEADSMSGEIKPQYIGEQSIIGEIVDPKCYFGVMKPGFGKIHRSCAALCISGGIPPVLVANDQNSIAPYYLLTDLKGNPINKDILPYIGQPSRLKGQVSRLADWYVLSVDISDIEKLPKNSEIY